MSCNDDILIKFILFCKIKLSILKINNMEISKLLQTKKDLSELFVYPIFKINWLALTINAGKKITISQ